MHLMDWRIVPPKRSFTAPFWIMFCIALVVTGSSVAFYIIVNEAMAKWPAGSNRWPEGYTLWLVLWSTLLWAETTMYWILRKRIKVRMYAWMHIVAMACVFIIIPLVSIMLAITMPVNNATAENYKTFSAVSKIIVLVFWILLAIGHAFFIATIAKSFSKKDISAEDDETTPGILDGILDEY